MEIHLKLAGVQLGPFTVKQVREYLADGLASSRDLAKHEGMADWDTIGNVLANLDLLAEMADETTPEPFILTPAKEAPPAPEPAPAPPPDPEPLAPATPPSPETKSAPDKESAKAPATTSPLTVPSPKELSPVKMQASSALEPAVAQKAKRKPVKIVIQPIQPMEASAPIQKNVPTPVRALPLTPKSEREPSVIATPSVNLEAPREKKPVRAIINLNQDRLVPGKVEQVSSPVATAKAETTPVKEIADTPLKTQPKLVVVPVAPPKKPGPPALPGERGPLYKEQAPSQMVPPLKDLAPMPPGLGYYMIGVTLLIVNTLCLSFCKPPTAAQPAPPPASVEISPNTTSTATNQTEVPAPAPEPTPVPTPAPTPVPTSPPSPSPALTPVPAHPHDPTTATEYDDRGIARLAKGDADGAISDFNQALTLDSKDLRAYYQRGLARQANGNMSGALADFTEALGIDPKDVDAYSNRAFVKQADGDMDGAIADYSQALLINPKIPVVYYNRGLIKEKRGDLDGAILDYNQALDLDPTMAIAFYNRGNAKNTKNDLDGAIADYTQALTLNPKISLAYCNRGFARQSKGDTVGAMADYTQALDLNPKMTVAYYNRGLIKEQNGDLDGAIADSTQAIDLAGTDAEAYCNRGLARFGKGDLDGSLADLQKFCELAPRENDADYARLYIWLISTMQNPKGHADDALSNSLQNEWNSTPEDFISKIAAFVLGHITENELIADASSPDATLDPGQHCKAWFFVAMKRLLKGDKAAALDDFRKCVATKQTSYCEYIFAQAQLQTLGQPKGMAGK